jgi:preprotein translocase subunit SecG
MIYALMVLLFVTALFLIVLILIQRGKGGGLAGAFGGLGGQSAFGTKAGDLFTRITIGVAAFWIILCILTVRLSGTGEELTDTGMGGGGTPNEAPDNPSGETE